MLRQGMMKMGWMLIVALGLLMFGCAAEAESPKPVDAGKPVSSQDSTPAPLGEAKAVTVEGQIKQIMESYPPQLKVQQKDGSQITVALKQDTQVVKGEKSLGLGDLPSGAQIRVSGTSRGQGVTADRVEILGN